MSYSAWKLAHEAGVILFLGNIITGLFWAAHARRTRDLRAVAVIFDGLVRSDRWFTLPCVFLIVLSGIALAGRARLPVLGTGWVFWSIALFVVSGILFGIRVAPLQRKIFDMASRAGNTEHDWRTFCGLYRRWEAFGVLSIAAVVISFVLMVLKPPLPGL
ncbi:MAG: DUF2269 domain-containing protein [Acidobacteria bacterium]|nr:DUF2269 domain-containing protein [Acidobacteriota bacterium]